jgi:signal transduction histidine kinase
MECTQTYGADHWLIVVVVTLLATSAEMIPLLLLLLKRREVHRLAYISKQELLRRNEFINYLAHEIRNPLNAVMGMSDTLKEETATTHRFHSLGDTIYKSAQQIQALLTDLLDLGCLELQKMKIYKNPFCPRGLVREICQEWREAARKAGSQLTYCVTNDVPNHVKGDVLRMR